AHAVVAQKAAFGLVISASHNPFGDNGVKVFGPDGFKLSDATESAIEAELLALLEHPREAAAGKPLGSISSTRAGADSYVEHLINSFAQARLSDLRVVVDCAHGAAFDVAPSVLQGLGVQHTSFGVEPTGRNINDKCGALHPESAGAKVREVGANLGITLDGDADRVILLDEQGQVVDGDELLMIAALSYKARGELRGNTLVTTVMSNVGLEVALEKAGISMVRTPVGDRYVVERLRESGFVLGGEQSGHIVCLDRVTTGDGLLAALVIMEEICRRGVSLSELRAGFVRFPQRLINVAVRHKPPFDELPEVHAAVRAAEAELGSKGRVLLRYSGTELKARVMTEGESEQVVAQCAERVADVIQKTIGAA
ncbi:MAG: phosphoglucosamine mutase, partial [Myxococcales bacterium]|nr:phosphoglucosamine mutase [Myxococcales bacterium]